MKFFKIISHPFALIMSFLFILISGQHFGGFYILYLLLALPHGGIYAIVAAIGIIVLVATYYKFRRRFLYRIEPIFNFLGMLMLLLSLFIFFYDDKTGKHSQTLMEFLPLLSLTLFMIFAICFFISNARNSSRINKE